MTDWHRTLFYYGTHDAVGVFDLYTVSSADYTGMYNPKPFPRD